MQLNSYTSFITNNEKDLSVTVRHFSVFNLLINRIYCFHSCDKSNNIYKQIVNLITSSSRTQICLYSQFLPVALSIFSFPMDPDVIFSPSTAHFVPLIPNPSKFSSLYQWFKEHTEMSDWLEELLPLAFAATGDSCFQLLLFNLRYIAARARHVQQTFRYWHQSPQVADPSWNPQKHFFPSWAQLLTMGGNSSWLSAW